MPIHEGVKTTGVLTSSTQILSAGKPVLFYGYNIAVGTTAQTVVKFRDGGASGTILWQDSQKANTTAGDTTINVAMYFPIVFTTDLYIEITSGTGTTVDALYIPL